MAVVPEGSLSKDDAQESPKQFAEDKQTKAHGLLEPPQTHLQDAEGKGDGLAKHVSRPTPYWAFVGHPQTEGGGAQGL